MKKALISPLEPRETGYRVADIAAQSFEVAPPFFWVDCADDVVADQFWYDPTDEQIKAIPQPEVVEQIIGGEQPVSEGAQTL